MKQYLDLIRDIMAHGTERKDRTGVGTISVFGRQIRFDMRNGFPAVTTKSLAWRSVVSELLWFLEGSASEHRLAEIKNDNKPYAELTEKERRTIWTANYEKQGRDLGYISGCLGAVYGRQWSHLYSIDFNQYELVNNDEYADVYEEPVFSKLPIDNSANDELIGKIFKTNSGDDFIVISKAQKTDEASHGFYLVQFLKTLSVKIVRGCAIKKGAVKDDYAVSVCGIGKMGYISANDKTQPIYKILQSRWIKMLERCYDPHCKEYKCYGAKGVTICKRWHTFANFLEDVGEVYGFDLFLKDPKTYQIDKDTLSGKIYSKDTCIFIPKYYNQKLVNAKPIIYKGELYLNIADFCEKNTWASPSGLRHHFRGRFTPKYKDVKRIDLADNVRIRYKFNKINQITNIINGIKNDPWSRRLLVSAWNPAELEYMALMPCHYSFQFYVSGADGEYLSLMWNQRSADVCLGIPFNIASYALLLHIIAKMTGKIPLELIGNLGDTHIYLNHLDGALEQLKREPKKLPELELPENADYSDIDSFLKSVKTSDFKLKNYEHAPAIKFDMAV